MIQNYTHEANTACVKIRSERQPVQLTHCDNQILVHTRWIQARARINRARLIEFVSEHGVVTRRTDRVSGIYCVCWNPRGNAALKTAILDNIV